MDHTIQLDYHPAPAANGFIVRLLLTLKGIAPEQANRVPLNLSLVLDRSGSMGGGKLAAARIAAAHLVRRLAPEDRVSVVAFDHEVTTVAEPAVGDSQAHLAAQIMGIHSRGGTNLSGGWLRGRELVGGALPKAAKTVKGAKGTTGARGTTGALNRVLLMTDGQANQGITGHAQLVALCQAAKAAGVTTSTIGFGADYDEDLLRGMADAGGGNAWYIERADQATDVFAEEIEGLLSLSAQNVTVTLKPAAQVEYVTIHNDYPTAPVRGGRRFELGDLYAREPRQLLVELFVGGAATDDESSVAQLVIAADVLKKDGTMEHVKTTLPVASSLEAAGRVVPEIEREVLLARTAKARDEAARLREDGDIQGSAGMLREAVSSLRASTDAGEPLISAQIADLEAMELRMNAEAIDPRDIKYLKQRSYNARRGRASYEQKLARSDDPPDVGNAH